VARWRGERLLVLKSVGGVSCARFTVPELGGRGPPQVSLTAVEHGERLLSLRGTDGFLPGWVHPGRHQPGSELNQAPESRLSVTYLLKLAELTGDTKDGAAGQCVDLAWDRRTLDGLAMSQQEWAAVSYGSTLLHGFGKAGCE
jgi:hypothetical protein